MKLSHLKKIRVIISLIFFISMASLFLDYGNLLSPKFTNYFTYLQFIPSLIKFIGTAGIAGAGFIFILLLALSFGRIYCSSICPLGTLQDIFSFLHKKIKKKKYFKLRKANSSLRHTFLFLAVILFLSGSIFAINLLDPYSNFGRITTQIFKPFLLLANNLASFTLSKLNIYSIYPVEIKGINIIAISLSLLFLAIVFWMSFFHGRLFCNTVCPVGTFLGLISRFSLFKIKIDEENCISCNLCERVCKSECIDKKEKELDFSRCVSCYNCFAVCPTDGINFSFNLKKLEFTNNGKVDLKKREFVATIIGFLLAPVTSLLSQTKIVAKNPSKVPIFKKNPVTPPGSISIEHFTSKCTACNLCISACPVQVLQPSFLDYGILGIMQPKMDYRTSFCNFECIICSQVCPSGAILPIEPGKKKITQLGKVTFVKDNCIVFTEKTDCGACAEHCPTKAVSMIPYQEGSTKIANLRMPQVQNEYCIGCGACEFACPVKPYKAIYVEGNPIHRIAKKKEEKKIEEKINYKEEFPF